MPNVDITEQKAIADIERMLLCLDKPKISQQQEYWQNKADELAVRLNLQMVVTADGGNYQVWPKSVVDRCGVDYVYVTGGNE